MWQLIVTIWIASPAGAETTLTETLAGYRSQAECVADIHPAVEGRMSRQRVVTAAARCERQR